MIVKAACIVTIPNIAESKIIPLHRHGDIGKSFLLLAISLVNAKLWNKGLLITLVIFTTEQTH